MTGGSGKDNETKLEEGSWLLLDREDAIRNDAADTQRVGCEPVTVRPDCLGLAASQWDCIGRFNLSSGSTL